MVTVLYTKFFRIDDSFFYALLDTLPDALKERALKFRKWEDQYASLIGKQLLIKGLNQVDVDQHSLVDLKYTSFDRPYLNSCIDFNISHSGNYVVCVLDTESRVGVDIEQIRPVDFEDFKVQYSEREWKNVRSSKDPLTEFYRLWTRKEALVKAEGRGLNLPMRDVDVSEDRVDFGDKTWSLRSLNFEDGYCAHLASGSSVPFNAIRTESVIWPYSFIKEK